MILFIISILIYITGGLVTFTVLNVLEDKLRANDILVPAYSRDNKMLYSGAWPFVIPATLIHYYLIKRLEQYLTDKFGDN